jgi:hypothetical protein
VNRVGRGGLVAEIDFKFVFAGGAFNIYVGGSRGIVLASLSSSTINPKVVILLD